MTYLFNEEFQLTDKNFTLYAAQNYTNPRCLDPEEFKEDLVRFKYLKRLFSRYNDKNQLQERLILNHLIIIHNVFGIRAANAMCFFKIDETLWPALKPFLIYLNVLATHDFDSVIPDLFVVKQLQNL